VIELIFDSLLRGSPSITALAVGGIYPTALPKDQSVWPAIHYLFVGGSSKATQDTYGSQRSRVEVNCWGTSYNDAVTLRHAVIAALAQYSANGVFIQFIQPTDFFDYELLEFRAVAEFYVYSNFSAT
jgi:Protein of unknown function (DUF3168)